MALEYLFQTSQVKHPTVSVIVTCHNYAAYIESCLNSIARQSYRHFECLIVDDHSTDDSVRVIERFIASDVAAGQFRLVRHQRNEGQMAAFETGLEHTGGSFVTFVDADDLLFPDFLDAHLRAHLNSARLAAVTSSELLQIASDGQVLAGLQGIAGTPALRTTRGSDYYDWRFSSDEALGFRQVELPLTYVGPWEIKATGWIWSTTSAAMFRRAALDLIMSPAARCMRISADRYLLNFSHSLGGSLLIRSVHGCYRRHGANGYAMNPLVGGTAFLGDLRRDPAGVANDLIFQHVLRNFAGFRRLVGRHFTIGLLRRFGPRNPLAKLRLAAATWRQLNRERQSLGRDTPPGKSQPVA